MAMLLLLIVMASLMMDGRKRNITMRNHRIELLVDRTKVIKTLSSHVHHIVDTLVQELHEKCSLSRNTHLVGLKLIRICKFIQDHLLIF
jgi:hypothetical protein